MAVLQSNQLDFSTASFPGPSASATVYAIRAWWAYNGNTSTIYSSANVSSISNNGGEVTVNLATALPDTNYCLIANESTPNDSYAYDASSAPGSGWKVTRTTSQCGVGYGKWGGRGVRNEQFEHGMLID